VFVRFATPLTRRSEPDEPAASVDATDVQVAKAYDMVAGLELGDANKLTDQGFAEEEKLAPPT